ncbi:hypothetical protein CDAR_489801 [Caerostris darwini]|uniref:Uncharacterized protein n=1 Tax=Caerostris darwini TaxID=1538125 RepID=A0AAV4SP60_9ARAC|nr:hypothetical protein CDAR_489801 [Caerostris darwini]
MNSIKLSVKFPTTKLINTKKQKFPLYRRGFPFRLAANKRSNGTTPVAPPLIELFSPRWSFLQRKCPGTFPGVDKKGFLLFFLHYFFTGESKIDGRPRMFSFRQPNLLLESHWPFSPAPKSLKITMEMLVVRSFRLQAVFTHWQDEKFSKRLLSEIF